MHCSRHLHFSLLGLKGESPQWTQVKNGHEWSLAGFMAVCRASSPVIYPIQGLFPLSSCSFVKFWLWVWFLCWRGESWVGVRLVASHRMFFNVFRMQRGDYWSLHKFLTWTNFHCFNPFSGVKAKMNNSSSLKFPYEQEGKKTKLSKKISCVSNKHSCPIWV